MHRLPAQKVTVPLLAVFPHRSRMHGGTGMENIIFKKHDIPSLIYRTNVQHMGYSLASHHSSSLLGR